MTIADDIAANREKAAKYLDDVQADVVRLEDFSGRPVVDLTDAQDYPSPHNEESTDAEGEAVPVPAAQEDPEAEGEGQEALTEALDVQDVVGDVGHPVTFVPGNFTGSGIVSAEITAGHSFVIATPEAVTFLCARYPRLTVVDPRSSRVLGKFENGRFTTSDPYTVKVLGTIPQVTRADAVEEETDRYLEACLGEVVMALDESTGEFVRSRIVREP